MTPTNRLRACGAPVGGSRGAGYRPRYAPDVAEPISPRLSDDQLRTFAEHGSERTAEVGEVLYDVGDTHYPFIVILDGEAAIQDAAHVEASRAHNEKWLGWLTAEIGKLGLEVTPSIANFVLIHFPDIKGRTAEEADAFLTQRGLILRRVSAYKLPNALRMSVGSEEANRLVVGALAEFLSRKDRGR